MVDDLDKWKRQHHANIEQHLKTPEGLCEYIRITLNNFCHRYLSPDAEVQEPNQFFFLCEAEEPAEKAKMLTQNKKAIDSIHAKKPVNVKNYIMIAVPEFNNGKGAIDIIGVFHWGSPEYSPQSPDQDIKKVRFEFDDVIEFRNELAKYIEKACEVF